MSTASFSSLHPTSPVNNPRYDQNQRVNPVPQKIPIGFCSSVADPEPQYLPPCWTPCTHPEGNVYFLRNSVPKVVTSADMYDDATQETIEGYLAVVENCFNEMEWKITDSVELYLEPSEGAECCLYYLVDHATRVVFWLDAVETNEMGMLDTVPGDHLRYALEALYWQHIEYFPCHEVPGMNLSLNKLIDIFAQAQTDHMTSSTSTFSYTAKQSKDFAKILTTFRASDCISASARWTIARLWCNISNYKTLNHHGQKVCRLSIDQRILDVPVADRSFIYQLMSIFLFKAPESYLDSFNKLWVDEIAHVHLWTLFADSCQDEWKSCLAIGFALFITNLLLSFSPLMSGSGCPIACILLSNAVIVAAMTLLLRFRHANIQTASQAAVYLDSVCNQRTGFQAVSILYSLPKALLLWTLVATTLQTLLPLIGGWQLCIVIAIATSLLLIQKAYVACSARQIPWPSKIWQHFRHAEKDADSAV